MTASDGTDPDAPTDRSRTAPAAYSCPDCGAETINGQGVYTCAECDWDATSTSSSADPTSDSRIFGV